MPGIFRPEHHRRAQTSLTTLRFQHRMIDAMLALIPKSRIRCNLFIGHRFKPKLMIEPEHSSTGRNAEYLCPRIHPAAQSEYFTLDRCRNPATAINGVHDQPAIRHELPIAPGLDIRQARPIPILCQGYHRFSFVHLCTQHLWRTLGNARSPHCCGRFHLLQNRIHIFDMSRSCYNYMDQTVRFFFHLYFFPT